MKKHHFYTLFFQQSKNRSTYNLFFTKEELEERKNSYILIKKTGKTEKPNKTDNLSAPSA